jgi:uncharacterized damage-inducible protein DinB
MLSESERGRALNYLAETRPRLIEAIESFPSAHFSTCPADGCWSAAKTLEHIVFVERRAMSRIHGALREPADPSRSSGMQGRDEELWAEVRSRSVRIKAPPVLEPVGDKSLDELVQAFNAARDTTIAFARETEADLRRHLAPHPLFGELDCYQWLMLIPSHGERHRAQIEEIRAAF